MYSKKINQLATNLNPQETDLIPIGDAETGQLKTTTFNAISGVTSDGVISGGIVTWTGTGLNFNISACNYILNGVRYSSPFTTKTLAAADPTNPRIDVFAVDVNGQVVVIQGTPNANPVEPEGDTPTTLGLTNVTINAGATTPNAVTKDMIYDENVETWTKTQSVSGSFNYNDTAFPYTGAKALLVTMSAGFADFRFSKATAMDITTYKSLSFAIRLNAAWTGNTALAIQFYNGTRLITNTYQITATNTVGFNRNLAGIYQLVTIPLNGTLLRFSQNTFTAVRIYTFNAAATYRLDTISLNGGINNPTGGGTTSANSFGFVNGSTGSAASTQATDTLNVVGTGLATTSATGKTLTIAVPTPIPSQTGNTGKFLTTDGSVVSWAFPTDTGITSLNGLGATIQTFATGTSGTDFSILSASSTHTFNLPTASATNRGALSSADWSTFNGKQNAITLTTTGTSGAATLVGATLNIPQYQSVLTNPVTGTGTTNELTYWTSSSAIGSLTTATYPSLTELSYVKGVTSAIQTQIDGKQGTLTLTTTGTSGAATLVGSTLNIPQYSGASIGGTVTGGTTGSVLFVGASSALAEDNANFFWDDTNNRLGIGTNAPSNTLDIIRGTAGAMGRGTYESASFSYNGDMKFGLYTSAAAGSGGSSLMFAATNFTANGTYPGFELQFSPSATLASNYIRFNYVGRDSSGAVTTSVDNILSIFQAGNVSVGSNSNAGYKFDVNGTGRFQDNLLISKNQNATTQLEISNTTSGTDATTECRIISDATTGSFVFGKHSAAKTAFKIIAAKDSFITNNATAGDIAILNNFATGKIKLAAGGVSTAQMTLTAAGRLLLGTTTESTFLLDVNGTSRLNGNTQTGLIGVNRAPASTVGVYIKGSGSTSSTYNLLGTDSAGNNLYTFLDDGTLLIKSVTKSGTSALQVNGANISILGNGNYYELNNSTGAGIKNNAGDFYIDAISSTASIFFRNGTSPTTKVSINSSGTLSVGTISPNASAILQVDSTTQGFLSPRMTTTQRNAIATPAAGLIVYDTTDNKHYGYNGTTWNAFF